MAGKSFDFSNLPWAVRLAVGWLTPSVVVPWAVALSLVAFLTVVIYTQGSILATVPLMFLAGLLTLWNISTTTVVTILFSCTRLAVGTVLASITVKLVFKAVGLVGNQLLRELSVYLCYLLIPIITLYGWVLAHTDYPNLQTHWEIVLLEKFGHWAQTLPIFEYT